jgi:hypothetical protein
MVAAPAPSRTAATGQVPGTIPEQGTATWNQPASVTGSLDRSHVNTIPADSDAATMASISARTPAAETVGFVMAPVGHPVTH